jgi:predicted AAA+ superfamily ATPase
MDRELLKKIIFDYHNIIRSFVILPREYSFEKNANYVLVGLRRAGKSTMMFSVIQSLVSQGVDWEQIIYINFEDERLIEFSVADFNDILQIQSQLSDKKAYYFFDEIQNVFGWERFARRLADAKEFVYITGSNANMLSSDIESRLGGRYLTKKIYPYSFREYLAARGVDFSENAVLSTRGSGRIRRILSEYMNDGGFPESLLFVDKRNYVENIYQKIMLGDIIARNDVRNVQALRLLVKKIAETVMNDVSYSRLHKAVKAVGTTISKNVLIDYIAYLEEAFLIFKMHNFISAFAARESYPKYYFSDNGLLNLFLYRKESALLENVVAISLYKKYKGQVHYFKSAKTGIDVDFYIPEEGLAVQAAYSIRSDARTREITNLVKFSKSLNDVKRCIIVTFDEEEAIESAKSHGVLIEVLPLAKFLLNE